MGSVSSCCASRTPRGRPEHPPQYNDAYARYPGQYVARRGTPPCIDGDVYKSAWDAAEWSEPFVEIRGNSDAPAGTGPSQTQETRMKMLWDKDFLYIAAVMDVAAGDELVAKFEQRNSPIFHTDSDFEVFVDPAGSCHQYKELEMNAINTVWNLMLSRPYSDGGGELSARVAKEGEPNYWEVKGQRTATKVLRGALHDASQPAQWCCEIALPHSDNLDACNGVQFWSTPAVGAFWRINFSRVEKKGTVNWVWTPQIVWSPAAARYEGKVNMHLPDAWGYVVFADEEGRFADGSAATAWEDPAFPVRHAAMCIYYAAHSFKEREQRQANNMEELKSSGFLTGAALTDCNMTFRADETLGFVIKGEGNGWKVCVHQDRFTEVCVDERVNEQYMQTFQELGHGTLPIR